jgi:hypothetical protein
MTFIIDLSDEQAAILSDQAAAEGLTTAEWLQRMAQESAATPQDVSRDDTPIWEKIVQRMAELPNEVFENLPRDGASEHDHYLYGTPKRNS